MTQTTYDALSTTIDRQMTNQEWVTLIAEEFKVSRSIAKTMLHQILSVKAVKTNALRNI